MAGGSVKLSIYSTFKDDGTKKAERAIDRFTKKFGQLGEDGKTKTIDDATRQLVEQSVAADQAAAKWQGYSDKLAAVGASVAKRVSAPAAAVAGASLKLASDYEDAFAKVKTIMDKSAAAPEQMSRDILALSTATGKSATELSEATYQAISASVATEKAVGFTGKAVELAKVGFTETSTAVDTLTTTINAYRMSADDAGAISDKLVQTQNKGKTTVDELASSIGNVIPTAAAYGVNLDNLLTGYVELTKQGINTANSTTYLNGMMTELANAGSDVAGILADKTGKSFGQLMGDGMSLADVLQVLYEHVDGNSEEFANLWGNVRASKGALAIANAGAAEFNAELEAMRGASGNVAAALEDLATPSAKANKAINAAKNAGIELGEQFLGALSPVLSDVAAEAQGLAADFAGLSQEQKQAAAQGVLLASGAAPVIMGASKVAGGIGAANEKLAEMTAKLAAGGKASQGLAKATGALGTALSGPGVAAFAAVSAVAAITGKAVYDTWKRSDEMTGATKRLTDACTAGAPSLDKASGSMSAFGETARRASVDVDEVTRAQDELAGAISQRNQAAQESINRLQGARDVLGEYMNRTGLTAQEQGRLRDAVAVVNEQCGTQYQVVDAVNGKIADEGGAILETVGAIDQYIARKQEQIRIDALSENLSGLYRQQADDIAAVASATDGLKQAQSELAAAESSGVTGERWQELAGNVQSAQQAYDEAKADLDAVNAAISATESQLGDMSQAASGAEMTVSQLAGASAEVQNSFRDMPEAFDSFCRALEDAGVSAEQFNSLSQYQLIELATSYDGTVAGIVAAMGRMGSEVPGKARAAAAGARAALEGMEPPSRAAADRTVEKVTSAFAALAGSTSGKGAEAGGAFASGIASGEGPAASAGASVASAAAGAMSGGDFYSYGYHAGSNFAAGILAANPEARSAAEKVTSTVKAFLGHSVAERGPLHNGGRGEAEWGEHAVGNFARGMRSGARLVERASAEVARAVALPAAAQGAPGAYGPPGTARIDPADVAAIGREVARAVQSIDAAPRYVSNMTVGETADFDRFTRDLMVALDMEAA